MKLTSILAALFGLNGVMVHAAPAASEPFRHTNKDGTSTGDIFVRGGPAHHWLEDSQGFTICHANVIEPNNATTFSSSPPSSFSPASANNSKTQNELSYYYCDYDTVDGGVKPRLDLQVGSVDPLKANLRPGIVNHTSENELDLMSFDQELQDDLLSNGNKESGRKLETFTGIKQNLVVLFKFSNHANRDVHPIESYHKILNRVKEYYYDHSLGNFQLESTIVPWIVLDENYTEAFCAGGKSGLKYQPLHGCLTHAMDLVESSGFDLSPFKDNFLTFIHSGNDANFGGVDFDGVPMSDRLWSSHRNFDWTSPTSEVMFKRATVCTGYAQLGSRYPTLWQLLVHEIGHRLGLLDLNQLREWSVMSIFTGFDRRSPPMDPYSMIKLGWATPIPLDSTQEGVELRPSYTTHDYYIIRNGFLPHATGKEYFLLEFKTKTGFDSNIPQEGLLIYHIDEHQDKGFREAGYPGQPGWPENNNHFFAALVQADGKFHLERGNNGGDAGDVFHSGGVDSIGPGPAQPNTDSYALGEINPTGIRIENVKVVDGVLTFDFFADGTSTPAPSPAAVTPAPTQVPTMGPTQATPACVNDPNWTFFNKYGGERDCAWVGKKKVMRCKKIGEDGTSGWESCPESCGCPT